MGLLFLLRLLYVPWIMIRGVIAFDNAFDSLAPVCDFSKSFVLSKTDIIFSSLTARLKYSISLSRAFSTVYGWDG